jgi:type I restriction enzyme S subunit
MASRFELTPMSAFLKHRQEFFVIDDTERYMRVTARLHGQGVVLRDQVHGSQLRTKKQQATQASDLLVAEIDAKVGGVGIIPPELTGAIVSSHYFLYEIDETVCCPKYLECYIRSGAVEEQFQEFVQGSTNYASIRAHHTIELQIPLPPLDEQRRIVACIKELEALIQEAQGLRVKAREEAEALLPSAIGGFCSQLTSSLQPLAEVLAVKPSNGWSPRCDNDPSGTPVLTLSAITGFRYDGTQIKTTSLPIRGDARYWLQKDDLLISRSNTLELVGHAAIYDGFPERCIYPDLVMRTQVKEDEADVRFVHYWLMSPLVRDFIRNRARGTSPTMKKIAQRDVMEIPFPKTISLAEQRYLVAYLDELQAQVDELTALQDATQAEMDALLPSMLDRAFRGEL